MGETYFCSICHKPFYVLKEAAPIIDAAYEATKAKGGAMCPECFRDWYERKPKAEPPEVLQRKSKYVFTDDMGEISGFGGGYEQTCRNMLAAGLEWFDEHSNADPKFLGNEGIYGVIIEEGEPAKALSKAVVAAANGDCTGAMHQAVISHCLWIRKNGWELYCEQMRKPKGERAEGKEGG